MICEMCGSDKMETLEFRTYTRRVAYKWLCQDCRAISYARQTESEL